MMPAAGSHDMPRSVSPACTPEMAPTTVRALVEQGLRLALDERRKAPAFRLRDASVAGHGLQPGAEGLSWDALRALAYGDREGT